MRFNGCHNRAPFRESMIVADGYFQDGVTRTQKIKASPFRMAMDCQYTLTELGKADPQCVGCKWKKESYEA